MIVDTEQVEAAQATNNVISTLEAIPVEIPWRLPQGASDARAYRWAFGVKPGGAAALVKLTTSDGLVGWGEASALFHPAMPAHLLCATIESLAPSIVGFRPQDIERLLGSAYNSAGWHFARGYGNYALSGIEMACWDIIGQLAGLPLCDLLGGRIRDNVDFMYFVYRDELNVMVQEAQAAVKDGFNTIYSKVGVDADEDVAIVDALREAIGPTVRLRVDANEAWSPGMAVRIISELERYRLEFVEQPVMAQDIRSLASVRARVRTPICADQGARTMNTVLDVICADAADLVSVCPADAGGILAAKKAATVAEAGGLPVFLHSNIELGIATAAHLHLAASLPNCHYANQTEHQFLDGDVLEGTPLQLRNGQMAVPTGPGLGVRVDEDLVRAAQARYIESIATSAQHASLDTRYLPSY